MYASTLKGKLTSCRNSFFHLANLALYKSQLVTCPIKNAGIILLPWAACGGRGGGLLGFLFLSTCSRHIFSLYTILSTFLTMSLISFLIFLKAASAYALTPLGGLWFACLALFFSLGVGA
jgi:hypothetical protein